MRSGTATGTQGMYKIPKGAEQAWMPHGFVGSGGDSVVDVSLHTSFLF